MNLERFNHIVRASGFITAIFRQNWGDEPLIDLDQNNQRKGDDFIEHAVAKISK